MAFQRERKKAKMGSNRGNYNELLALTFIAKPITDKLLHSVSVHTLHAKNWKFTITIFSRLHPVCVHTYTMCATFSNVGTVFTFLMYNGLYNVNILHASADIQLCVQNTMLWWCLENHQWGTRQTRDLTTPAQHKKKGPNRKHWCGAGQIPSEGQVRTSLNSRVLERGQLCVPWLVRISGLL